MEHKTVHIVYSAEEIQRYLAGKMSPQEMNALEKAALDDSFLAEALEGYESLPVVEWQPQLAALKESFAAASTPVVSIRKKSNQWWKYAAAAVVAAIGIGSFWLLNKNEPAGTGSNTIASTEKAATIKQGPGESATPVTAAADSTGSLTAINTTAVPKAAAADAATPNDSEKNRTQLDSTSMAMQDVTTDKKYYKADEVANGFFKEKQAPAREEIKQAESVAAAPQPVFPVSPAVKSEGDDLAANNKVASQKDRQQSASNFYNQQVINNAIQNRSRVANNQAANRFFTAQVVRKDNTPLPFANINVQNEGFGTYADVRGNVRLFSSDSLIPVEIRSLGYKTQTVLLRSNGNGLQNRIVLQEDHAKGHYNNAEMPSVMAKRKSSPVVSRRAMLQRDSAQNAEPADGWDNYDTYVSNNFTVPDNIADKNVHGAVELSFEVNESGVISNVKVDKSLCNDCDEIARRIVEQGPQWKVKKGRKTKARIKLQL